MNHSSSIHIGLKKIEEKDWKVYLELNTSKVILKYHFEAGRMKSIEQITNEFENIKNHNVASEESSIWAVYHLENNETIGICTLAFKRTENEWHIGFRLLDKEWKKGIGYEVLSKLIEKAKALKIKKLNAVVNIGNIASEKILQKHNFIQTDSNIFYNDWQMNKFELILQYP